MSVLRAVVAAALVAAGVAVLRRLRHEPEPTDRQLDAAQIYVWHVGLPVEPDNVALALRLRGANRRGALTVLGGGLLVAGLVVVLSSSLPIDAVTLMAALYAPALALFAVVRTRAGLRVVPPADRPHVAHAARPSVADYAPALVRWWPAINIVVGAVVVADYAVNPPPGADTAPGTAVALWAIATPFLIGNMFLARWLVAQPQPAATPAELALRNEFVAETVGLLLASSTTGFLLWALGADPSPFVGQLVGVVLVFTSQLLRFATGGRVRRRLWKQRLPVPGT